MCASTIDVLVHSAAGTGVDRGIREESTHVKETFQSSEGVGAARGEGEETVGTRLVRAAGDGDE